MLWKAAQVQLRNIKAKNVGSYFPASQILASPALLQVRLVENKQNVTNTQTFQPSQNSVLKTIYSFFRSTLKTYVQRKGYVWECLGETSLH